MRLPGFFQKPFAGDNKLCHGFASKILLQRTGGGVDNKLTGQCHCGRVVFDVPASLDFSAASRCDCSFCRRRAAVMVSCPLDSLKIQQGDDVLTLYQWNTHTAQHYFCKICGIYNFHRRRIDPLVYGVNVGCFDDIDILAFQDAPIEDGVSLSLVN